MSPDPEAQERFDARCAVIGAGPAGLITAKALLERDIDCDVWESGADLGGMWRPDAPESPIYDSLQLNSSKAMTEFRCHPMPAEWPDFPDHGQMLTYLRGFAETYDLRPHIRFGSPVTVVRPVPGPGMPGHNGWAVTRADGATSCYENVIVANGHHRTPHVPALPGEFTGQTLHSREFRNAEPFAGRRVLVVGAGNSGADIAVELAGSASRTILASRHELRVLPRYLLGKPIDQLRPGVANLLPAGWERSLFDRFVVVSPDRTEGDEAPTTGDTTAPAAPPVAPDLPGLVEAGTVEVRPAPRRLSGPRVTFTDGSTATVDVIVWATGYRIDLPFLSTEILAPVDNTLPLYRRVVAPQRPGLWFVGFVDTVGATLPLYEQQAEWLADLLTGGAVLPGRTAMRKAIEADLSQPAAGGPPLLVDQWRYSRQVKQERGRRRAKPKLRDRLTAR